MVSALMPNEAEVGSRSGRKLMCQQKCVSRVAASFTMVRNTIRWSLPSAPWRLDLASNQTMTGSRGHVPVWEISVVFDSWTSCFLMSICISVDISGYGMVVERCTARSTRPKHGLHSKDDIRCVVLAQGWIGVVCTGDSSAREIRGTSYRIPPQLLQQCQPAKQSS